MPRGSDSDDYARLWIGGLETGVTEDELEKKFGTLGKLKDVKIRSSATAVFGYVEYESRELAKKAIATFDQDNIAGRKVKVTWAQREGSKQHLESRTCAKAKSGEKCKNSAVM